MGVPQHKSQRSGSSSTPSSKADGLLCNVASALCRLCLSRNIDIVKDVNVNLPLYLKVDAQTKA
ncbi:unnamed protein product [Citrullus colocynthis]|uniref:Uncharacterized protein n=1 Tax=Citrullus colocynthis TaxID=252529 RepID=A0ABP0XRB6_9ROSI